MADARKVALTLASSAGSWTSAAARAALAGSDEAALSFVRTGVAVAAGQDDRAKLAGMLANGSDAMRAAANRALAGSDADVAAFLRTGDYPGRHTEDRIAVDRVLAAAQKAGDKQVEQRAQRALDLDTDAAMRQFLATDRFTAAAVDDRLKANAILASQQDIPQLTELKVAAQIALDGPPAMLHQFLAVGQYEAAQRDQDAAAHEAVVSALLQRASEAATKAVANAQLAQSAAWQARGDAQKAADYADQAHQSADRARIDAQAAQRSAENARDSAGRAAASANTARNAATSANQSARQAARSVVWANASAGNAANYARDAYAAAREARDSAVAAGKSAEAAAAAADQARDAVKNRIEREQAEWAYKLTLECQQPGADRDECMANAKRLLRDPIQAAYVNAGACGAIYPEGSAAYKNCVNDTFDPNFGTSQALNIAQGFIGLATALYGAVASLEVGIVVTGAALLCNAVCGAIMEVAGPVLAPEFVGVPLAGYGLIAGTVASIRTATLVEGAGVEARAEESALARWAQQFRRCAHGFAPRGPVRLMQDETCDGPMVIGVNAFSEELAGKIPGAYTFNDPSLKRVIGTVNGQPFAEWQAMVTDVFRNNGKVAISFGDFGPRGGSFEEKLMTAYRNGSGPMPYATEWEIYQLGRYVQRGNLSWGNITFYDEAGHQVSVMQPTSWG